MVDVGDQIILTKGDLSGVSGKTNAMKILEVRSLVPNDLRDRAGRTQSE